MKHIMAIALFVVILASGCTQTSDDLMPRGTETTTGTTGFIDCGSDRECFEENMKTCTRSRFSYKFGEEENLLFSMETLSEIRGPEGNNCVIYGKIIKFELSEDFPEDIPDYVNESYLDVAGKEMTCRIPLNVLSGQDEPLETMGPDNDYCEGSYMDALEEMTNSMGTI